MLMLFKAGFQMRDNVKNTILSVILILAFIMGGSVGVTTLIIKPFDYLASTLIGVSFITSGIICWGWNCFSKRISASTKENKQL